MTYQNEANEIVFYCPHCGNEMTVAAENAGGKGRCPKCKMVIAAPMASENTLELIDWDKIFQHPKMNKLYAEFASKHADMILAQKPEREKLYGVDVDVLTIALRTGVNRRQIVTVGRHQCSWNSPSGDTYQYHRIIFGSRIGAIDKHETSTFILRQLETSRYRACINDENMVILGCHCRLENIDYSEFEEIIFELANLADQLEERLFGADMN